MSVENTLEDSVPPDSLKPGTLLGRYTLEKKLGQGGMGVVWAARDPDLERTIALKLLRFAGASDDLRKRLLREARAMAKLKHPNVLTVYEVATDNNRDFIAMELVEGSSLQEWLATSPRDAEVWAALLAAGRGLAAAHAAGLVHRDFKPANVLRGIDGRVLVTDFGLARALGEEVETSADKVLDVQLTHTGMLLGTPAYMAPEQFDGAEPDPRTDQFAFCVSAWQMLTGSRPYHADNIADLKFAATSGTRMLATALPKGVRAVLERGLDPKPEKRWASMDELLVALEATRTRKVSRIAWIAPVVASIGAVVAIKLIPRDKPQAAATCVPATTALAQTWSPAMKTQIASNRELSHLGSAFDRFATRWTTVYNATCAAPKAPLYHERLGCLLGMRDEVSTFARVVIASPDAKWDALTLPDLAICESDTPIGPPRIPDDDRRDRVMTILAEAVALPARDLPRDLEKRADATGWDALAGLVLVRLGNVQLARRDFDGARDTMKRAFTRAQRARDFRSAAQARLGLYEASVAKLESPVSGNARKGELHEELARLSDQAGDAIEAAGNDPHFVAAHADLDGDVLLSAGIFKHRRNGARDALESYEAARAAYEKAGDWLRVVGMCTKVAGTHVVLGALDEAEHFVRKAEDIVTREQLPSTTALDEVHATVAFARGEFAEAHARYDTLGAPTPGDTTFTGHVVDETGAPVAGGLVVAWRGELRGDGVRVYTDPRFSGDFTRTDVSGAFTIHAAAGDAIVAQLGEQRSLPQLVADHMTVRVLPTYGSAGSVTGSPVGVFAFARYAAGAQTWIVRGIVRRDLTYHVGGLPRGGKPVLGMFGDAGEGFRRVDALAWPSGQAIDVVVTGVHDDRVVVLRGKQTPTTAAELAALVAHAPEVASGPLTPIGSDTTDGGATAYSSDAVHVILTGNDGEITVCVVGAVKCTTQTVKPDGTDATPVAIAVP